MNSLISRGRIPLIICKSVLVIWEYCDSALGAGWVLGPWMSRQVSGGGKEERVASLWVEDRRKRYLYSMWQYIQYKDVAIIASCQLYYFKIVQIRSVFHIKWALRDTVVSTSRRVLLSWHHLRDSSWTFSTLWQDAQGREGRDERLILGQWIPGKEPKVRWMRRTDKAVPSPLLNSWHLVVGPATFSMSKGSQLRKTAITTSFCASRCIWHREGSIRYWKS